MKGSIYLDFPGQLCEIQIRPTPLAPVRQEGSADAGIQHDEAFILGPQAILPQDLAVSAEVEAGVVPLDDANIGLLRYLEVVRVFNAVQDEDKVGGAVEALVDKELDVLPRRVGLCVGVQDQRPELILVYKRALAVFLAR